jgi:CxxC motif-containing protein (DUF1111 family)
MLRGFARPAHSVALALTIAAAVVACDTLTTAPPNDGDLFDAPLEGLTGAEMAAFVRGDAEFGRPFSPNTGLGPIFNDVSCAACHSGDGRGALRNSLARIGTEADGFLDSLGGPQIQNKAISGAEPEVVPAGVAVSLRLPPPVFGSGLIEAIPASAILANVDSLDLDADGISGRPNFVTVPAFVPATEPNGAPGLQLGRFGRKAQTAVLLQQVVVAYLQDIGITSPFLPLENRNPKSAVPIEAIDRVGDPEVSEATVQAVTHYLRALAPPEPGAITGQRVQGQALFTSVGCVKCHVTSLPTGPNQFAVLANKTVTLYSDLLLHDMGPGLADNRPDGQASGTEWRTTPLWGLRLMRRFMNGQALLMHDGRAKSVEEAILLHGGEALISRNAFAALTAVQKAALLDFVESR